MSDYATRELQSSMDWASLRGDISNREMNDLYFQLWDRLMVSSVMRNMVWVSVCSVGSGW